MSKILISYRREDSAAVTGRIYDRLIQEFGSGAIFKDVDSIPFGVDFRKHLDEQVAKCEVFLAVIGREWIRKRGSKGKSRLEDPGDFVRIEVESALKRDIPIIPVLVSGAAIPAVDRLPPSLHELSYRHGIVVRDDPDFHRDMDRLIDFLKQARMDLVDQRKEPSMAVLPVSEELKANPAPVTEEKHVSLSEEKPTRAAEETPSGKPGEVEEPSDRPSSVRNRKTAQQEAPFEMVKVPKGPFLYGENKTREVIEYDYWIDQYPVTNKKYAVFISAGGYDNQQYWSEEGWKWKTEHNITGPEFWTNPKWNKADHPVVGISYYEAEAYAKWAGKRLPSEWEWEKAARGEDGREYPWGEAFDKNRCNSASSFLGIISKAFSGASSPVNQCPSGVSPYGCYDMAGNVWEWCADWYDEAKDTRVVRGGSWSNAPVNVRSAYRDWLTPTTRNGSIGFRCAQDNP